MKDYPIIRPRFAKDTEGQFAPFERDSETLAREWAVAGRKGLEHRIGGLEKTHKGVLSTDPKNHELMVRERAEKVERVAASIPLLEVDGPKKGKTLIVGWGGTYGHILTAISELRKEGREMSFAHFNYISPLPSNTAEVFSGFSEILVCELNSGQFAGYLRTKMPQFEYRQLNKVQGQTFMAKDIKEALI